MAGQRRSPLTGTPDIEETDQIIAGRDGEPIAAGAERQRFDTRARHSERVRDLVGVCINEQSLGVRGDRQQVAVRRTIDGGRARRKSARPGTRPRRDLDSRR